MSAPARRTLSPAGARGEGAMLYGAGSIARFLGIGRRQAYHLAEVEQIPTFKVGAVVCAQPDALRAWLADRSAGGRRLQGAATAGAADDRSQSQPPVPPQPDRRRREFRHLPPRPPVASREELPADPLPDPHPRPPFAEFEMTDLSAFTFEGATIRVAVANGRPWFLLLDLCDALDLGAPDRVASRLVPEALCLISDTGEGRLVPAVTESGTIALSLRTPSLAGRRNKAWLLEEVLPAAKQLAALGQPGPRTIMTTATVQNAPTRPALLALPAPDRRPVETTGQVEPAVPAGAGGELMPFSFGDKPVRVVTRDGEPWFVLADVCRVLEIANPRDAASRLDQDEKRLHDFSQGVGNADGGKINGLATGAGNNEAWTVNQSGLYSLVLTSRKPEAKAFKKWITGEVLPAIRRTGGYMVTRPEETPEQIMARALLVAKDTIDRTRAELAAVQPKVAALERIEGADGSMSVTDAGKVLGLGQREVFQLMQRRGWLFRRAGGQSWLGYQDKVTAGLLEHRVTTRRSGDGREVVQQQVLVTAKGLTRLAELLPGGRRAA